LNFQEIIAEVLEQLRGMWRYRLWAAVVAWIIAVGGWFAVYSMPDEYRASARIYVDTQSLIGPVFQGLALSDNVSAQVEAVSRALLTRPNLESVARDTDLDLRAKTALEMEELITDLQDSIRVTPNRERDVFDISFEDVDRETARDVVAAIVDAFVENSLEGQGDDAQMTARALEAELRNHENRLLESESRLAQFKKENLGFMPDDRGDYYARLQTALAAVDETAEEIRQLEVASLEAELAGLQVEFTDKHPRIVILKETIASLREKCTTERAAALAAGLQPTGSAVQPLETNPVYQNLRIQLSDSEVELASLRAQLATQRNEVATLRQDVDKIAQVETDLKKLNRDYGVVQERYQELLGRMETLRSKQRLDPMTDTIQFRTLEPPFAAAEPVGPNRPLFLAAITVVGIGLGAVLTFGLNLLNPVFFTRRSVKRVAGLPVLGSVSLLLSVQEERGRRRRAMLWAGSYVVLLVAAGLAIAFQSPGSAMVRELLRGAGV
jgi:uncharacterized protein involved in exopolysaccharide biosynthesis